MAFKAGTKVWHPEFHYCKYVRPLVFEAGLSYVEAKGCGGVLQKVKDTDLLTEAPPKLTREQKWELRFRAHLAVLVNLPISYWVAGWILTHPSKFNLSYPPGQLDQVVDATMKYGVDFTNQTLTESSDLTCGWSCSVVTETFAGRERLEEEAGVKATTYFTLDTNRVSMQAREFVLGFLGGTLGFKLGDVQDINAVRTRVPAEFILAFEAGLASLPQDFGTMSPLDPAIQEEEVIA